VDGDGDSTAICDIGAYEFIAFTFDGEVKFIPPSQGTVGPLLVGGVESTGLARGPAFQLFDADGTFLLGRFVLNPDFTDVDFSIADVASDGVIVCGRETGGLARGPAFQLYDINGNFLLGRFVLNTDFADDYQCLGADLDGVAGDEMIVGGSETGGSGRGPAFQVWDKDGNFHDSASFLGFECMSNLKRTRVGSFMHSLFFICSH